MVMLSHPLNMSCGLAAPEVRFWISWKRYHWMTTTVICEALQTIWKAKAFYCWQKCRDSKETGVFFNLLCYHSTPSFCYDSVYFTQDIRRSEVLR